MTDPSRRDGWGQEHPGTVQLPRLFPVRRTASRRRTQAPVAAKTPPSSSRRTRRTGTTPTRRGSTGRRTPGGTPPEPPKPGGPTRGAGCGSLAATALLDRPRTGHRPRHRQQLAAAHRRRAARRHRSNRPRPDRRRPRRRRPPPEPPTTTPTTTPGVIPPTTTTDPNDTHTVVYSVAGEGRAISILYLDSGGVLQTEFNVMLPWSKEVQLAGAANSSASVSIVNVGRELTCSITIDGTQTQQNTGTGLTLCTALGDPLDANAAARGRRGSPPAPAPGR